MAERNPRARKNRAAAAPAKKGTKKTVQKSETKKPARRARKVKVNRSTASKVGDWKAKDLKPAPYNPRFISEKRLKALGASVEKYGDLSGVVLNRRSGLLISGHQRTAGLAQYPSSIKTKKVSDGHGTVEEGHIAYKTPNGIVRFPFRVVDWDEDTAEKGANIAANAHGGDFDREKLAKMVHDLEDGIFDVESTGIDPLMLRTLPPVSTNSGERGHSDAQVNGKSGQFKEFDEESFDDELQHTCPRCNYQF